MKFSEKIKMIRSDMGVSQSAFGEKFCISYQTIMKYENKQSTPTYECLCAIADGLGITLSQLLEEVETGI